MAGEADQNPCVADKPVVNENKSDSEMESGVPVASSSSNVAVVKMAEKTILEMVDYWKMTTVTETDRQAYHSFGWLNGGLESTVSTVEYPVLDNTTMVCFESHLVAGLGLPPSKFLVAVMSHLGCELIHFNPNAIAALSCFMMLCECWLGIASDTSLFWYFYSLARYEKVDFSEIGLSLCHHRWDEYIPASFRGSWKGASRWWFLVDMHIQPQWVNRHLLPPLIDDERGEPKMAPRLAALIKQVAELYDSDLHARHCVDEFTLQQIRSLDRWGARANDMSFCRPIQAVSLLLVKSLTLLSVANDMSF
jgi:hypothetical protein